MLLACAVGITADRLTQAVHGVRDWDALHAIAGMAQLRPQLSAVVGAFPTDDPDARRVRDVLVDEALAHEGRGRFLAGELLSVLEALHRHAVAALPFKGPAFARIVGDGSPREMNDLDIIVRGCDIAAAVRALASLGYRPLLPDAAIASPWLTCATHELPLVKAHDGSLLELHWRLAPAWCGAPLDVEQLFTMLQSENAFGRVVAWPRPEALVLMHVADGIKSGGELRWVADILAIIRKHPRLDWEGAAGLARDHGALDSVCVALAAVETIASTTANTHGDRDASLPWPAGAKALAIRARSGTRMPALVDELVQRITAGESLTAASAYFGWSIRVADSPARAARGVLRFLAGPAYADLQDLDIAPASDLQMRWRALRRRLVRLARA